LTEAEFSVFYLGVVLYYRIGLVPAFGLL